LVKDSVISGDFERLTIGSGKVVSRNTDKWEMDK